jgi:hypothetical protein
VEGRLPAGAVARHPRVQLYDLVLGSPLRHEGVAIACVIKELISISA